MRRTPLVRHKALRSSVPLARGAELVTRSPLLRTAPAKPSRRRDPGVPRDVRALVWDRAEGRCEICGKALGDFSWRSLHHRRPLAMGGSRRDDRHSPANLLALCGSGSGGTGCHDAITDMRHGRAAGTLGFLLPQGANPAAEPALLLARYGGWVLLDHFGGWRLCTGSEVP